MKIIIDETKIEYRQSKSIIGTLVGYMARWFRNIVTMIPINPPYKYKGIKGWFKILRADEVGKSIRVEPNVVEKNFEIHQERLKLYDFFSSVSYFVFAFTFGIGVLIFIAYLNSLTQFAPINFLVVRSFNLLAIVIGTFSALLAAKIAGVLLDRRFADSLILPSSLYLIIDLYKYDDLSNPDFKRNVIERIQTLRRNTLLLSQTFIINNSDYNQEAILKIKNIEFYIREREGWAITPHKDTLKVLRKDFEKLAILLINGQYGEFKSKTKRKIKETTTSSTLSLSDRLLRSIFTLFPYIVLALLYFKPEYINNIGLDVTTAFLVAIAWILLTIDAKLKLGLVDRVTGFAKTIKELQ